MSGDRLMDTIQLARITKEVADLTRWGVRTDRLTHAVGKGREKRDAPYGPIHIRFCEGANWMFETECAAREMKELLTNNLAKVCGPYLNGLIDELRGLLGMTINSDIATRIRDLGEWYEEAAKQTTFITEAAGKDYQPMWLIGLQADWAMHVPCQEEFPSAEEQAMVEYYSNQVREALAPMRNPLIEERLELLRELIDDG